MGERNQYRDGDREQDRMHQHGIYRNGDEERTGLITSVGATELMPPADARAVQRKMLLRNAQPGSKNAGAFLNLWQGLGSAHSYDWRKMKWHLQRQ